MEHLYTDEPAAFADDPSMGFDPTTDHTGNYSYGGDTLDGDPTEYQNHWFYQEQDGLCGPSSVAELVSQYTGLNIDNPQYMEQRAQELGLFADGDPSQGMTLGNLQTLLSDQGVPCHVESSDMSELESRLDGGYGVIAFVNAETIWGEPGDTSEPDHALVVAGIDETKGVVYLSDPGNPDGNVEAVPISTFESAWDASGDSMLVADSPAPDQAGSPAATPVADSSPWAAIDLR
jgi:hypothetical protein